jgi:cell division septation protein DedD
MSTKRKRASRRRQKRSFTSNPLLWLGGILGTVVLLVALNLLQSGVFADPPAASRSEDPASLLPLAEAKRPLEGEHDMRLIPQQTPAPQPAPEGVALPKVDLPSYSYDFGLIPKRPDVAHVFAVQNTGTADLQIWNLVTSCGCTTAQLSSSVIPPGQRADLTVVFDPDFHVTQGETVRLVWFATNDPTHPWVEVRITADVE